MRVGLVRALTMVAMLGQVGATRLASADVVLSDVSPKLSIAASLRARAEYWDFFEPRTPENNEYTFGATVLRAGATWKDDFFDLMLEAQSSSLFRLPDDAIGKPPGPGIPATGVLGLGALYFANNRADDDASVFLKQGFVKLKQLGVEGLSVKGGRFEFSDGAELPAGEPTLDWLRNVRIQQRLIGPFGFSHVGRSFDGGTASYTTNPSWCSASWWPTTCAANLTIFGAHPTQGGFDLAGNKQISDITLGYASASLTRPKFLTGADARLFYIYYGDDRGLLKTDNRPLDVRTLDRDEITVHSEGGHLLYVYPTSAGPLDLLLWGVVQQGDWGTLTQKAWAYDFEAGWQPAALPGKPWIRIGFGRASGDDDPADGDHGTFFQILPTGRIYSYSTFYNLMNDEDAFVQLVLRPVKGLVSRTDFHNIRLVDEHDLWYQGSGATVARRDTGFGYSARPANGEKDLFQVIETSLTYEWGPHLSMGIYYAHLFGGDVVRKIFRGDDADFGLFEVTVKI